MNAPRRPRTPTKSTRSLRSPLALLLPAVVVTALVAVVPSATAAPDTPFADGYDGSDLWLHYVPVSDEELRERYRESASAIIVPNAEANKVHRHTENLSMEPGSAERLVESTLEAARDELNRGLDGLLDTDVPVESARGHGVPDGAVVVGTPKTSRTIRQHIHRKDLAKVGDEGYLIRTVARRHTTFTVIAANTEIGALYGSYDFLRRIQTQQPIHELDVTEKPKVHNRHLNNWDTTRLYAGNNADGTGGLRGEDGSIFNFSATGASADRNLPVILDRYLVSARAMASVGINGITINNVNADNAYLTDAYIEQEAALADALRPYGIKLSVSINYTAPTDERFAPDTLTEDQLDPYSDDFRGWWNRKATQIKEAIPDFTGFTVKANSEGQPGPQDFGYDHGDGANGIGAAVEPLGMTVYWRTFVYNADLDPDRLKRAYLEFGYIDDEKQPDGSVGRIADNVFLQTKNGPLDYQPREPIHPMFGRMENTNQAIELQITQEYTGQNIMLAYLGPMWEEVFKTDAHALDAQGKPLKKRLVGNIVDGSAQGHSDTAVVGVTNLGNADNLTGHHFSQANFYSFGRQAWDWTLDSEKLAEDWARMTWSNDQSVVDTIVKMMMGSLEAVVSYQTPLGIGHQFGRDVHYVPAPWEYLGRDDWSPVYYNKADSVGLSYDRSPTGSNFTAQYFPALERRYGNLDTVPENLMMWFHHVPWDHTMNNGRQFWDELVYRYQMGVQYVTWLRQTWDTLEPHLDARRFSEVQAKLAQHEIDAKDWRDACVGYWQEFSGKPIPTDGPLSASIVVNGTEHGGFDAAAESYSIPVPEGGSPEITEVRLGDPAARYEIVSQAGDVPGQAVVKVTKESFFGPIVKNYVFEMVPDTTLSSLTVNGTELSLTEGRRSYNALVPAGGGVAEVAASASDPAAEVTVEQAGSPTGQARVSVTNGAGSTEYTVNLDHALAGDEFNSGELGKQWQFVREDAANWRLSDGALRITSQQGDLQEDTDTAKNIALQDVNGDWTAESKVVFSRPLANDNEQGGIVAYADDDNYVKLAWEMADVSQEVNKLRVVLLTEQGGKAETLEVTGAEAQEVVGADGAIWLRLAKSGNAYKAYYSGDGEVYRYFGTTTVDTELPKAGLAAFNRAGTSTDLSAAFDYFRLESKGQPVG